MKGLVWAAIAWPICLLSACATPHAVAPPTSERQLLDLEDYGYGGGRIIQPVAVYSDSNYKDTMAEDALNPSGNIQWASDGYQEPRGWWVADLGTQSFVRAVGIKTGDLDGASYRIELSDNGAGWRPATGWLGSHTWDRVVVPINATGRFLRVHFRNDPYDPIPRFAIYQITIFGQAGPLYGGAPGVLGGGYPH